MGSSGTSEWGVPKSGNRCLGSWMDLLGGKPLFDVGLWAELQTNICVSSFPQALTGNFPFDSVVNQNEVIIQIIEGNIPNITEDPHLSQFNSVCKLIKRCWDMDPQNRPSAAKCHSYMANLASIHHFIGMRAPLTFALYRA